MKISSISELKKITKNIKKILKPGDSIFLYGEIGVGKTTFSRILINTFESENNLKKSEVLSPTFNIVFEYEINKLKIKHYDFYRIKTTRDIENIGLFENIDSAIHLIEWPELINEKPLNRLDLFFKYKKDYNERSLKIKTNGRLKKYEFK
tara:strand:+ start:27 stop:476 length:450 start_codon:yes stop_codon:yes gene_type:complete